MTRNITSWLIIVTIIVWVVWDIYVGTNSIPGDTESEVIRDWAWDYPSFAAAIGVLCGHWFWTVEGKRPVWMMLALWFLWAVFMVLDVFFGLFNSVIPILPFSVGVLLGHLMWPLEHKRVVDGLE
jgi:hypothetical protein